MSRMTFLLALALSCGTCCRLVAQESPEMGAGIVYIKNEVHAKLVERFGQQDEIADANARVPRFFEFSASQMDDASFDGAAYDTWATADGSLSDLLRQPLTVTGRAPRKDGESLWNAAPREATLSVRRIDLTDEFATLAIKASVSEARDSVFDAISKIRRDGGITVLTFPDRDGYYLGFWVSIGKVASGQADAEVLANPPPVSKTEPVQARPHGAVDRPSERPTPPAYDSEKQYLIKTQIVELDESLFLKLQSALSFQPQDNGAMLKMSGEDARQFSRFVEEHRANGLARVLSQPVICTVAGQPASVMIGKEIPYIPPANVNAAPVEFKPVGLELNIRVWESGSSRHFLEWELTNSNAVGTTNGQKIRTQQGFDGATAVANGDAVLVATRTVSGDQTTWLVTVMQSELVSPIVPPVAAADATPLHDPASDRPVVNPATTDVANAIRSKPSSTQFQAGNIFDVSESSKALLASEDERWTLHCPLRVRQVLSFDPHCVSVDPVYGDPKALTMETRRPGTTTICLIYEDDSQQTVNVTVTSTDRGLNHYLNRLYPNRKIAVHRINESVLLRGQVASEMQQQQIVAIAERFFPRVLNQLQVDATSTSDLFSTELKRFRETTKRLSTTHRGGHIVYTKDVPQFLVTGRTYTIECPQKITKVTGFDTEKIRMEPVAGQPDVVRVSPKSTTSARLTIHGTKDTYSMDVIVEYDVSNLSSIANRLYPGKNLIFVPVQSAVVIQGVVESSQQSRQVAEIAAQYYPTVLNHLIVADRQAPEPSVTDSVHVSPVVPANVDNSWRHVVPVAPASFPSTRDADIDAIRTDIKALHQDVRGLIKLLQRQQSPEPDGIGPIKALPSKRSPSRKDPNSQPQSLLNPTASPANATLSEQKRQRFLEQYDKGVWLVPALAGNHSDGEYLALVKKFTDASEAVSLGESASRSDSVLLTSLGIKRFPALLLICDGEAVDRLIGPVTPKQLQAFTKQHETWLSRRAVPLVDESVVAIRRIRSDGTTIHPIQFDIGAIIASEPGRSIVAVPTNAVSLPNSEERQLVCLFPGTVNEQIIGADVLYDYRVEMQAESESPSFDIGFSLLEIQYAARLPVCPVFRGRPLWGETDPYEENPAKYFPAQQGQAVGIFRPRSMNEQRHGPVVPSVSAQSVRPNVKVESSPAQWKSVVCDMNPELWNGFTNEYHVDLDLPGAWLSVTRKGEMFGFGRGEGSGKGTTILSVPVLDSLLAMIAVTKNDTLLQSAVNEASFSAYSRLQRESKRDEALAAATKMLGFTVGRADEETRRRLSKKFKGCLYIHDVAATSAAARAGLRDADYLLGFGGYEITTAEDLAWVISACAEPGTKEIPVLIQRGTNILRAELQDYTLDSSVLQPLLTDKNFSRVPPQQKIPENTINTDTLWTNQQFLVSARPGRMLVVSTNYRITDVEPVNRPTPVGLSSAAVTPFEIVRISDQQIGIRSQKEVTLQSIALHLENCPEPFEVTVNINDGQRTIVPKNPTVRTVRIEEQSLKPMQLFAGESVPLNFDDDKISRVEIGDSKTVTAEHVSDGRVVLRGLQPGFSSVHVWINDNPVPRVVELTVVDGDDRTQQ